MVKVNYNLYSVNHYPTDSNHYHVRKPPAMKVPYRNSEVHL